MSIFEDTNPKALKELLSQIDRREAVLPDFQRDFVWEPKATQELIVSIMQNYPAGSLLRIRNAQNMFAIRQFEGAEPLLASQPPTFLVLDGQQRLTSLYQAFYGKGSYRYYLNIRHILKRAELDECVFYVKKNDAVQFDELVYQAKELILPLSILKNGLGGFMKWAKQVARTTTDEKERHYIEDTITEALEDIVQKVDDYAFPVVTLSDKTGAEAVCTIFETLNRTGVKLSPFELLVARFYPKKVYLRNLWDKALQDYPVIEDFDIDPYYILLVITLSAGRSPSAKRSDVLDLNATTVDEWWLRAVRGMATTLEILRDDCGVLTPQWLPYNTIVLPLAAVLTKNPFPIGPGAAAMRKQLVRWYWCAVFGQAYEASPTTQASADVTQLVEWLNGGNPPDVITQFNSRFKPESLRDTAPRQRAVYRGVMGLVLRNQPLEFYTGKKITGNLLYEDKMDAHHIFPVAYLKQQGIRNDLADSVLNRTLIGRDANKRVSAKNPADYFNDIELALNSAGSKLFTELLDSHLLPAGSDSPLKSNDYESFLTWRLNAIWREIQAVTSEDVPDFRAIPAFPKVKDILDENIRQHVQEALPLLTEENVDMGLFRLGREFENTLKAYLEKAIKAGKVNKHKEMKGDDPDQWRLVNLIDCARENGVITDQGVLHFLRYQRNERAHGVAPSLEERKIMMKNVQFLVDLYIDYIKFFDDKKHTVEA